MKACKGFSLIELLVVLVILAITVGFAVPTYRQHVLKAQLADARAALLQNAQYMERMYSQQGSYLSGVLAVSATNSYSLQFDAASGAPTSSSYTIVALSDASGTTTTNASIDQNGTVSCFTLASVNSLRAPVPCP